jgi:hypothetical protein
MLVTEESRPIVFDYDEGGFDYRKFWFDRDYEQWGESRVIRSLIERSGHTDWLADFGGGFGRNSMHYRNCAAHAVIIDYSLGNLQRAADALRPDVDGGRVFLVRADLYRLPFADGAFTLGLIVRVLHHLESVDRALLEMGRTVGRHWIIDVPIKHHLLACTRSLAQGNLRELWTPTSKSLGPPQLPFINFHLKSIRRTLRGHGWRTQVAASVNNFRRWDRILSPPATNTLRPLVYGMESVAQLVGRGWWGPSQFLWAERVVPKGAGLIDGPPAETRKVQSPLSTKVRCPGCRSGLQWSLDYAVCTECSRTFPRRGAVWDFLLGD